MAKIILSREFHLQIADKCHLGTLVVPSFISWLNTLKFILPSSLLFEVIYFPTMINIIRK